MSLLPLLGRSDSNPVSLSTMSRDQEARVVEVRGSTRLAARLRELGFTPGVQIRVVRAGWTLVVQIGEGRLCIRRRDAASVRVDASPTDVGGGSPIVVPDHLHRVELVETAMSTA